MNGLIRCQNGHLFSSRRYGTVCPYCNMETNTQEKRETGVKEPEDVEELLLMNKIQPVCGWIVCIEGPRQGKDYKIHAGKNFVGRADDMDIQILGDNKISRRNHAILVYDPKKHETVLLPGDSNGIVYHNDNAVYVPVVLSVYDVIEIGDSKFLFVPFCGEHFRWEESPKDSGGKESAVELDKTARS